MKRGEKSIFWVFLLISVMLAAFLFSSLGDYKSGKNVDEISFEPKYSVVSDSANYYKEVEGYLVQPKKEGNYPGVLMVHEWWGLNENIKKMADNLASLGYVVLAVDLYEGEVTTESSRAGELAGKVRSNPEKAISNMNSAIDYLKNMEKTEKVASLGWCFGGQQSLQISLNNSESLDATVIYYGNLVTEKQELSKIDQPVLGIFGSEDNSIPVAQVNEFNDALDSLQIENEIYVYQGVGHAFANPSGSNYAATETEDAWKKTVLFLDKNLK